MTLRHKIVIDTQIFLRALINQRSASYKLLTTWRQSYTLFITDGIIAEVIDVLTRSAIRQKFPQITPKDVAFVEAMLRLAINVPLEPGEIEVVCRDPKDDVFLACAKKAGADYLISEDKDLLVIEEYAGVRIVNVFAFLQLLEATDSE